VCRGTRRVWWSARRKEAWWSFVGGEGDRDDIGGGDDVHGGGDGAGEVDVVASVGRTDWEGSEEGPRFCSW
jgi:hypothetical protein